MNSPIHNELARVNRRLNLWHVERLALWWTAGLAALCWALGFTDFLARFGRPGRIAAWVVFVATAVGALTHLAAALRRRRSAAAVASILERGFPHLDNHLINYVLFSDEAGDSLLRDAYLARGVPERAGLPLRVLRDQRAYRRAYGAAAAAILLLLAPWFWFGGAWPTALLRVLNPFSDRRPPTLATLISVEPGTVSVTRGEALDVVCRASGHPGQNVEVDLRPADDARTTVRLGTFRGPGVETFTYHLAAVTADLEYRVRAGDAPPSERFRVTAVPPLSLSALNLRIVPPEYTRLPPAETNALSARPVIPQDSRVTFTVRCNRPLAVCGLAVESGTPAALQTADRGVTWTGGLTVASGGVFRLTAMDSAGAALHSDFYFDLLPDRPPSIRVVAPTGRMALPAGAAPDIRFEIKDDYGLTQALLQRIPRGRDIAPEEGDTLKTWPLSESPTFEHDWRGSFTDVLPDTAFRLVAMDNRRPGAPRRAVSAPIVFDTVSAASLAEQAKQSAADATASVARLVELQRANLSATIRLQAAANSDARPWGEALSVQTDIRQLAAALLADRRRPVGSLEPLLQQAYDGPMARAIAALDRVVRAGADERRRHSEQAVAEETAILRLLTQMEKSLARVLEHQNVTGLLALLDGLVKGQKETLDRTAANAGSGAPSKPLARHQDTLAAMVVEFVQICRGERVSQETSDPEFAKTARAAAALAESSRIRADMLTAADHLENERGAEAIAPETRALTNLCAVQTLLNQWRVQDARRRAEQLRELVETAKATLEKMALLQSNVLAAIRATETQKDQSTRNDQALALENQKLKADLEEAALKLANDLQALPELPALNELVNDVTQIYEEMKQVAGSDKTPATELGLQKEDWLAEALGKALGKVDEMELWLASMPDAVKRNTETFDKQELPPIAPATLGAPLEDVIGDLLEHQEDIQNESDDSTGNQGVPDMPPGWAIAEGETTSYGAKGKTGNERPEHKDQDGRSNIGREGMSDGEIAAASGKINEGDKNIENRMTRDSAQGGEVREEDHSTAKATGGGKLSGYAEQKGMSGMGPRRDSSVTQPSELGEQALLRRQADAIYAQATLQHLRVGSMDKAIGHMRQAEDALERGAPLRQVHEYQRRVVAALKETRTELEGGFSDETTLGGQTTRNMDEQVASPVDEAPVKYRGMVSDYFKKLSGKQ